MKKLFTLIAAAFMAVTASADTLVVDIAANLSSDSPLVEQSDGTFKLESFTSAAWQWVNFVMVGTTEGEGDDAVNTGFDASAYDYLVVEFTEGVTFGLQIYVQNSSWSSVSATNTFGSSVINVPLGDNASDVMQVCAMNTAVGTELYVKSIYFSTEEAVGSVKEPVDIALSNFSSLTDNSDGTYTVPAGSDGWTWNGYWIGGADWSNYTYVVAELGETIESAGTAKIQLQYGNGASDTEAYNEAGVDIIVATLDETGKSAVNQIALQCESDFLVKSLYLTNTLPTVSEKTISLSNWYLWNDQTSENVAVPVENDIATFTCSYDWGWFYNYLGDVDCSDYNYYVVEFAEATTIPVMLGMQYNNDENGTWQTFDAGTTVACLALSETYKNSVKQAVLENGSNSDNGGTFYVSKTYFSVDEVGSTGISSVVAAPATNSDAVYNLSGQRVSNSYKGLVIKNGKKVIVK